MPTTVKIKRSTTTTIPTTAFGELAYSNIAGTSNLYIGNSSNVPVLIGSSNTVLNDTIDTTSITGTIANGGLLNLVTTSSSVVRTLPSASANTGKLVKVSNANSSTANVRVAGAIYFVNLTPSQSAIFESDGANWQVISVPANDVIATASSTGNISSGTGMEVCTITTSVTRTLPNAVTLTGKAITVVNAVSSTAILTVSGAVSGVSLAAGQSAIFESDGVNWQVASNFASGGSGIGGSGSINQFAYFNTASNLTSSNILGQSSGQIVLGEGDGASTVSALTIRGAAATGSNIAGKNITFQAENGTGGGGSGAFLFQTAPSQNIAPQILDTITQSSSANTNSFSFNYNVPAVGANRVLIVQIAYDYNTSMSPVTSATILIGSTTQTLTLLFTNSNPTQGERTETWYLLSPNSGASTITLNFGTTYCQSVACAMTISGVNQSTPFRTVAQNNNNLSPATISAISAVNDLVIDFISVQNNTSLTLGGGQTQIWGGIAVNNSFRLYSSSKPGSALTTSMQYTWNGGTQQNFSYNAFAVIPVPTTASNVMQNNIELTNIGILPVLNLYGGIGFKSYITTITSSRVSYLVTLVNSSSSTTQTLPSAPTCPGSIFIIKRIGSGSLTIASVSGNINGSTTITLGSLAVGNFFSDGTNWWTI